MSTKTSMMGLKVTYTFNEEQEVFLSKSPNVLKVKYGEMELFNNETRLIGVVKLKNCIKTVLRSSPEIFPNLINKCDHNVYISDFSEINSPLVGYGTLAKLIKSDYTDTDEISSKPKDVLVSGKVEKHTASIFSDNNAPPYYVCVNLKLKKVDRVKAAPKTTDAKVTKKSKPQPRKKTTNSLPAPKATRTLSLPIQTSLETFQNIIPKISVPIKTDTDSNLRYMHSIAEEATHSNSHSLTVKSANQMNLQQQQQIKKSKKNYRQTQEDINNNKENIPPELLSEISDTSYFTSATPNTSVSFHNDKTATQTSQDLDDLLNFSDFLANVYNADPHSEPTEVLSSKSKKRSLELSLTPDDNATPKDSEALTPIIESVSDKEEEEEGESHHNTLEYGDSMDKMNQLSYSKDAMLFASSPFTVYD